ncbi:hypothetical protein HMPREF9380_0071 [Streptococcus sanguinis SK49]|uniref:Uncharacterized protein n=1 Tax=Streptococcus sanguinis SK49 TaxID=888808 RepID=F3UU83_STRSA|nr:hypothetical protein HMPREF9380_0071 [Streptococcus sanguinis SK49]
MKSLSVILLLFLSSTSPEKGDVLFSLSFLYLSFKFSSLKLHYIQER